MPQKTVDTIRTFALGNGGTGRFHSLPALQAAGVGNVSRLPVSLRIVLESLLRHLDGGRATEAQVAELANWRPQVAGTRSAEIPFVVGRILLQDFTGIPLLCDLAAMRDTALRFGKAPSIIEPLVQVDLVVDHSVQVDYFREPDALDLNLLLEFRRNSERYRFIKWGMQAFENFRVVPPGIGIVHQVNLEYLARGVMRQGDLYFPDSLVGTDSHTTMINALGVLGWGVGGIEAEAGMLGQPVYLLTPDVIGIHLEGELRAGVTATDLVLFVTEKLRAAGVVGKFVEFFGDGAAMLTVPDRATIANMAPEYGATVAYFAPDEQTVAYLSATGRTTVEVDAFRRYFQAQEMFGMPRAGQIDYTSLIELNLGDVMPSVAGPKRPQDRISLSDLPGRFAGLLATPIIQGGYGKRFVSNQTPAQLPHGANVAHGDVLIAAITSCTNTSNPSVMLAAGLLAQNAVARGLRVAPFIKTSLAPGSRVVTEYLAQAGLVAPLEQLGFRVVAYGCTTCIGNSGPLLPDIEAAVLAEDLVGVAVLSGNRNFEARIHPSIKANFLMSPPLVVAFALAGRIGIDLTREALGRDQKGIQVFLHDIWPSPAEISAAMHLATNPGIYRSMYQGKNDDLRQWNTIAAASGRTASWDDSTYIARPPFLDGFTVAPPPIVALAGARALLILGDSITTDHISPAGAISEASPAGEYLRARGVLPTDFNSYGSRRGHHQVMLRGTFANVRLRNLMLPPGLDGDPVEGGFTVSQPDGHTRSIFDAAMEYQRAGVPTLIFAGEEYGTGSSRDWAAKGTRLLGVRAVLARSFERIHRSNLVGMGVLPLQFSGNESASTLRLNGTEIFDLPGVEHAIVPGQALTLRIHRGDGTVDLCRLLLRIDTPVEADYYRHGGIIPYVLRQLFSASATESSEATV